MTEQHVTLAWSQPTPDAAYVAAIDAAELCARHLADAARADLADAAHRLGADVLAVAAVQALSRLLAGPHASTWWARLREEANAYTSPEDAPAVVATLEAIALAEAVERGAYGRAAELVSGSELQPVDYAAIACQLLGLVVAHLDDTRVVGVTESLDCLRAGLTGQTRETKGHKHDNE